MRPGAILGAVSVTDERMRELVGTRVGVRLAAAGGGESVQGKVVSCLESADGLVVYLADDSGDTRTIHYQHIEAVQPLD
jgi:hypothetical protein